MDERIIKMRDVIMEYEGRLEDFTDEEVLVCFGMFIDYVAVRNGMTGPELMDTMKPHVEAAYKHMGMTGAMVKKREEAMERCLSHLEKGYKNLEIAAMVAEMLSPNGMKYVIEDTYFDLGQCRMWTTLVAYKGNGDSYQALYSKEWEQIVEATDPEQIVTAVKAMFAYGECPDRERKARV